MTPVRATLAALLGLLLFLALALALPAPVLGQEMAGQEAVPPLAVATQAPERGEPVVAPAATPPPIDCNKPPSGQHATLGEDEEILFAYAYGDMGVYPPLHIDKLDNDSKTTNLVLNWEWSRSQNYQDSSDYPHAATADLDGDGKDEGITAYYDSSGKLQVVSIVNPEATSPAFASWQSSLQPYQAAGASSVAAGDLDGAHGGDKAEEVAVAVVTQDFNLHLILLDGTSDGGIIHLADWYSTDHARGNTQNVAVAIGDLDGDGYSDEIALALRDGDGDLQVVVLEYQGSGVVSEIGWEYWTTYDRGNIASFGNLDVTTGRFDKGADDEIAVAFRDGSNTLQIVTMAYQPAVTTLQHRVVALGMWRDAGPGGRRKGIDLLTLASADIDADGRDEIVSAFRDGAGYVQLVTLDAQSQFQDHEKDWSSPRLRGSIAGWTKCAIGLSVDAGDIDKDGRAEVVLGFSDCRFRRLMSFDDPGLAEGAYADDLASGLVLRYDWRPAGNVAMLTGVALGDMDGNSLHADYTGVCQKLEEAHLIAMVNAPPYWPDLNADDNQVGYGTSYEGGESEDKEVSTTLGGSVKLSAGFELEDFEVSASFTEEWEQSLSQSWTQGSSTSTQNGWYAGTGFVAFKDLTYYTYQYQKTGGQGLARVSTPVNQQTLTKLFSAWNGSDGSRTEYPNSWVPAYRTAWTDRQIISDSIYTYNQGAGSDIYDINGDGSPDLLFAWIDNPSGENVIIYRIGWNVGVDGNPASWSAVNKVPDPSGGLIGWDSAGLGAAITELNGNGTPELVVAWVDDPAGDNSAYYLVGWDMDPQTGAASSWSGKETIPGWVGDLTQGAGLDIADISGNGRPEMVFGWIDNPADVNHGYYRVGWDLDNNGNSSNWWAQPKEIEGAFGPEDAGLGLTMADMDGNGQLELVAAWVRNAAGENEWAYATGENLDGNAYVSSWVPGHHIAGWVGDSTSGVALASANLVAADGTPELVAAWIDDPAGQNTGYLRVGKYWEFGGPVDQYPTDLKDAVADDGQFEIKLNGQWWNVSGDLLFRWDKTPDNEPIHVRADAANDQWQVNHDQFGEQTTGSSESYNFAIGGEVKIGGIGIEESVDWGFEEGSSYTISWDKGFYMDGQSGALPSGADRWGYDYVPFTYMQQARSKDGVDQAYMVLDYFVTYPVAAAQASGANGIPASVAGIAPRAPLVASPTHPDPEAWYSTNTATFTWAQPAGDPAIVDGYRWFLDHEPDTVPSAFSQGLTETATYTGLSDGVWYLHLRARGDGGDWSETTHRAVRVDLHPPQVTLSTDPPYPGSNGGWYNSPITLTVVVTDTTGSGVQTVEYGADGATWQPYTTPLVFNTEMPLTTLWARATDLVGQISEPVSLTFGLDLSAPTFLSGPACWEPGGNCAAEVITDAMGNEHLRLTGEAQDGLSGVRGLGIQINGADWTSASDITDGQWEFISARELGAGCHDFSILAEDVVGNVTPNQDFATGVVWHPRERPDLSGSSLTVTPARVRPGSTVDVAATLRNGGWQETWGPVEVSIPPGLHVLPDTLGGGQYDATSRTITWPPAYLWPGEERDLSFAAQVRDQTATTLVVSLVGLGTWPISEGCPPDAIQPFLDRQTELKLRATVTVDPDLPVEADVLPPESPNLSVEGGAATESRDVRLWIDAGTDAVWMYLREWTWSASAGTWIVAQDSGWLPYTPSHAWTLSEEDGVKYLGAWLADAAWNISELDQRSLTFTNLMERRQFLANGGRIQYRFPFRYGQPAILNVVTQDGNADLYIWEPLSGFRPNYAATATGLVDTVGFQTAYGGLHLVEVKAEGDSRYQLLLARNTLPRESALSELTPSPPEHPLTVSDPLSAGVAVAPAPPNFPKYYLPILLKDN